MKNPKKRLDSELNKIFETIDTNSSIKVSFLLSKLDLSILTKRTSYLKYPLEAILKLYLYKKVKGLGNHYEKTKDYFLKNKEEALQLGFLKNIENNILFPPKRTYNHYISKKITKSQLKHLNFIAEKILILANKNKILLDIEIVTKILKKKKDSTNKVFKEATKLVKKLIYPQIKIKLRHNAKFSTRDLLDVLVHVAYSHDFTTNGSTIFQELYPDKKAPSGDLMLHHFSKLNSIEQINIMFEAIFDIIFNFAKQNYKLLNRRKLNIAYDIHKIPYYGNKNDPYITEGKPERGTSHFYQFLTAAIVVNAQRFTIDAIPTHKLDRIDELLDKSLERIKNKLRINQAYFDRGFDKPKIINTIKKHKIKFIMPKIRSPRVKAWMKKSEATKARLIKDFQIGKWKDKAIINLYLVDDEDGIKRAFITNFHIPEQLSHYLYRWYSKRWGIETGYRNLDHDFKAKTTTKNYHIRLFYFLFSICLYNLWVLVNIVVSLTLYHRLLDKPLITAKLFAVVLYRVAYEDPPT